MSHRTESAGRSFYVPEVRVAKLGKLTARPEAGELLGDLRADILRVEVTRVASGLSQYAITLNNWFDSLNRDRAAYVPSGPAALEPTLLFPRYKYNHFKPVTFGERLRIDMRYWPDPVTSLVDEDGAAKGWVPMIAGPITDMKFSFAAGEGARVTITGEDDLHALTNKSATKQQFNGRGELAVVQALLEEIKYPLPLADPTIARPAFMTDARGISEQLGARQSYYDLIKNIAEKYDLECFVEFKPVTEARGPELELHLESARSRLPPGEPLRGVHVLHREKHLIDFTPTLKVGEQFTSAKIKGRHRIRTRDKAIDAEAVGEILADELHRDPQQDPPLVSAPQVRLDLFPGEKNVFFDDDQPNLDEVRTRARAESILRKQAREFLKIQATTMGLPQLRPGKHVEIRGFRPPFDGFYYVEKTVHSFGTDGLRTQFTARRPGMPLRESYEGL